MENKAKAPLVQRSSIEEYPGIVVIRLHRPQKANAYNQELLEQLASMLDDIYQDDNVSSIIFTGAGTRSFCAGADKNELKEKKAEHALRLQSRQLFDKLANSSKLSIAAINGTAMGGGLELALACDVRVCSPNAQFGLPEVGLGLTPAAGGMRRLPLTIGLGKAKEIILFGKVMDAAEAYQFGLVTYAGNDFMNQAKQYAITALAFDPLAVDLAKRALHKAYSHHDSDFESVAQALLYERRFNNK